ncbi:MAG: NAD(P)/FAD-dependent oxidoreductase, partial [Candidatus Gastranaerophilales bacterium]|nr:NAD(P)/FAD-dependent oxidoreductase [Candidatus Gastranaerophilales bacterium]
NEPLSGYDGVILSQGLKFKTSLIEKYGHKISPVKPVLTGLKIAQKEFSLLKGVSFNDILFTDEGITGPYVYKISSINAYKDFPYEIKIPLLNTEELEKKIEENPKKLFKNTVCGFIPKSLAEILIKEEKQCANVSKKEIKSLENLVLKAVSPDNKGAITHCGGVSLNEIDKNYKSKIASSLWIIGEVVDIDGFCGGFNLQHCWASAAIAAEDIANRFL